MKIEISPIGAAAQGISSYAETSFTVRGVTYAHGIIIDFKEQVRPWPVMRLEDMVADDVHGFIGMAPEIILIGTGECLRFPNSDVLLPAREKGVGVEIMDTGAACRCYNLLLEEGRHVCAALMPSGI
ncbi:MAG: Mth938-like domain-containing protein [Candidatus Eutrophobiaceae bacterium]